MGWFTFFLKTLHYYSHFILSQFLRIFALISFQQGIKLFIFFGGQYLPSFKALRSGKLLVIKLQKVPRLALYIPVMVVYGLTINACTRRNVLGTLFCTLQDIISTEIIFSPFPFFFYSSLACLKCPKCFLNLLHHVFNTRTNSISTSTSVGIITEMIILIVSNLYIFHKISFCVFQQSHIIHRFEQFQGMPPWRICDKILLPMWELPESSFISLVATTPAFLSMPVLVHLLPRSDSDDYTFQICHSLCNDF